MAEFPSHSNGYNANTRTDPLAHPLMKIVKLALIYFFRVFKIEKTNILPQIANEFEEIGLWIETSEELVLFHISVNLESRLPSR